LEMLILEPICLCITESITISDVKQNCWIDKRKKLNLVNHVYKQIYQLLRMAFPPSDLESVCVFVQC
jgi:hypothetical protein